jgi:hypothetical protein
MQKWPLSENENSDNSIPAHLKFKKKGKVKIEFSGSGGRYSMGYVNRSQFKFWEAQSYQDLWRHLDSEDQPAPSELEIPSQAVIGYWENLPNKFGTVVGIESDYLILKIFFDDELCAEYSKIAFHDDFCNCVKNCDEWFPSCPDAAENFSGKKSAFYYVYQTIESGTFTTIEFESNEFRPDLLFYKTIDFEGTLIAHDFEYDLKGSLVKDNYGQIESDFSVWAKVSKV